MLKVQSLGILSRRLGRETLLGDAACVMSVVLMPTP